MAGVTDMTSWMEDSSRDSWVAWVGFGFSWNCEASTKRDRDGQRMQLIHQM